MFLIFDLECTGLLHHMLMDSEARIHCLMAQELEMKDGELVKGRLGEFYDAPLPATGDEWVYLGGLDRIPEYLGDMSALGGHNIIEFDLPILVNKLGYTPPPNQQNVDSLIISRKNFPDRPGGHAVEAWGPRLGYSKVEHEDWSEMTVDVRHRCREDVKIETEIMFRVLDEMKKGVEKCQTA